MNIAYVVYFKCHLNSFGDWCLVYSPLFFFKIGLKLFYFQIAFVFLYKWFLFQLIYKSCFLNWMWHLGAGTWLVTVNWGRRSSSGIRITQSCSQWFGRGRPSHTADVIVCWAEGCWRSKCAFNLQMKLSPQMKFPDTSPVFVLPSSSEKHLE